MFGVEGRSSETQLQLGESLNKLTVGLGLKYFYNLTLVMLNNLLLFSVNLKQKLKKQFSASKDKK